MDWTITHGLDGMRQVGRGSETAVKVWIRPSLTFWMGWGRCGRETTAKVWIRPSLTAWMRCGNHDMAVRPLRKHQFNIRSLSRWDGTSTKPSDGCESTDPPITHELDGVVQARYCRGATVKHVSDDHSRTRWDKHDAVLRGLCKQVFHDHSRTRWNGTRRI